MKSDKEYDKRVIAVMTSIYCKHHHGVDDLCEECRALLQYSYERIDRCPLGERKVSCRKCIIHCYVPQKRDAMQRVMRFSGPRMVVSHPIMALRHLIKEFF